MKLRRKAKRDRAIIVKVISTSHDPYCRHSLDNAGMVVGRLYHADVQPMTTEQLVKGWEAQWKVRSIKMPLLIQKCARSINRNGRNHYYAPGVPGLLFADHVPKLEKRDTRRDSDWDKKDKDKRVMRRFLRQMAKHWDGGELMVARSYKR